MTELSRAALDLIFEPRGLTYHVQTNFIIDGLDVINYYMNVGELGTATAATTYLIGYNGLDLKDVFAAKGSVTFSDITWSGTQLLCSDLNQIDFATVTANWNTGGDCSGQGSINQINALDWYSPLVANLGPYYQLKWVLVSGTVPGYTGFTSSGGAYTTGTEQKHLQMLTGGDQSFTAVVNVTIRLTADAATETSRQVKLEASSYTECFIGETLVSMSDGTEKRIDAIEVGDSVKSLLFPGMQDQNNPNWEEWTTTDLDNAIYHTSIVVEVTPHTSEHRRVFNGNLTITNGHFLLVYKTADSEWVWSRPAQISIGDKLYDVINDTEIIITSIVEEHNAVEVYSIDVENFDTYFVRMGNTFILTHNK